MKRDFWSVVIACAFGAFTGALIGLEMNQYFQFPLGNYLLTAISMFTGGFVAYVGVEFSSFRSDIAHAWKATIAWRPNWRFWQFIAVFGLGLLVSVGSFFYLSIWLRDPNPNSILNFLSLLSAGLAVVPALTIAVIAKDDYDYPDPAVFVNTFLLSIILNPVGVTFLVCVGIAMVVKWLVPMIPAGARWIVLGAKDVCLSLGRFSKLAFRYVHTQRRTLCFTDAALGAAIGYHMGSAIAGVLAGAVLSAVNYELVSVRWLKIVPRRA